MILQRIIVASPLAHNAPMHYQRAPADPRAIIEQLRLARGIKSHRQLAIRAGISQPTLTRYLNGKAETMEAASFQALARVLHVTTSELLGEAPIGGRLEVREAQAILASMTPEQARQWVRLGRALIVEEPSASSEADPESR